jgi:Tfp pilus assembly protein PilV
MDGAVIRKGMIASSRKASDRSVQGFAMVEAIVGLALVTMMLSCVFALNAHLLGMLRDGKESTHASQMLQERVEQFRTSHWDQFTDPAKLKDIAALTPATAVNLRGATETFTVEPVSNPAVNAAVVRTGAGTITSSGVKVDAYKSVKITLSVQWNGRKTQRERGMVTVLTKGGI